MTLSSSSLRAIALLSSALALGACRHADAATEKPPGPPETLPVRIAPIGRGGVVRTVRGTGTVRLKTEVGLSFKVPGVVQAVLVEEGASVKKGQVLARLDPTEVAASLHAAEESVEKAERDLARVERLHASGALPVAQRDDAATGVRLARAAREAAAFAAQRAVLVAPDDGRVDRRMVEVGEVVMPGRPVLHLSGRSRGAVVRFGLTDRDALRLREGDRAVVHVDAIPDAPLPGKVSQIATVATPGAGTFDVEVRLDDGARALVSGLTAKVVVEHPEPDLVTVPTAALEDGRGDAAHVFVLEGDHVRRRPVRVAFFTGGSAALATPLDGATEIVSAGTADLDDGARVRVLR